MNNGTTALGLKTVGECGPEFSVGDEVYTLPDIASHRLHLANTPRVSEGWLKRLCKKLFRKTAQGTESIPVSVVVDPCRFTDHIYHGKAVQFYVDVNQPGYGFHQQNLVRVADYDPEVHYKDWYLER